MVGFFIAVFLFNFLAIKTVKRLTKNQIIHIWIFTTAFQTIFDTYIDLKYAGYWYFTRDIDLLSILNLTLLVQPVNLMFLNWYPIGTSLYKQIRYFIYWEICLLAYEAITTLPEPFGFFHYGWWHLWYSTIINPFLLFLLLCYYKWILRIEKELRDAFI